MNSLSRMAGESSEARRLRMIKDFINDARYALRQLRASPGFALPCLLSLALGIGATTLVYSVIRGVLLHPFPYRGADRMITFRVTTGVGYNGFENCLLLNRKEMAGCALGVACLYRGVPLILQAMPKESLPNEASVEVNLPVLLFAISAAIATAVLFGLWPALQSSRVDLVQAIQASSGRVLAASISRRRFLGSLIAGQVALTVLLLALPGHRRELSSGSTGYHSAMTPLMFLP